MRLWKPQLTQRRPIMVCLRGRPFRAAPLERNDTRSQAHRKTPPPCCQHVLLSTHSNFDARASRVNIASSYHAYDQQSVQDSSPLPETTENYTHSRHNGPWVGPVTRVISSSHSRDCLNIARIRRHQKEDNSEVEEFTT